MTNSVPTFDPDAVSWAHTVLFQALIVQLVEDRVLSVDSARRVFDVALERAKKERARSPDAERLIQHIHDHLKWDDLYGWAAQSRKDRSD